MHIENAFKSYVGFGISKRRFIGSESLLPDVFSKLLGTVRGGSVTTMVYFSSSNTGASKIPKNVPTVFQLRHNAVENAQKNYSASDVIPHTSFTA